MTLTRAVLFTAVLGLAAPGPVLSQTADRAAIDRAIAAVYPSLVRISVVAVEHEEGREIKMEASGSGTIISPDGFVITNHHVAGRTRRIICTLPNREEVPADLVGTDPLSDIAVLKLRPSTPRTFPAARFGSSSTLQRGEAVLAMGSPLSVSQSVTLGVVSNTQLIMPRMFRTSMTLDGEDVGSIVVWIGHDAAIFPGNSGGPLVNLNGEIVGVNEISFGLAGAIPSNLAQFVANALIKEGTVRRSWLGFEVQPLVGGETDGVLVAWVAEGSPAARAGVQAGDILQMVGDAAPVARFAEQLPTVNQLLYNLPVGKPVRIQLQRHGKGIGVEIVPEERGLARSQRTEIRAWGITAADLSPIEAREQGRASREGAAVINLRPGGPAAVAKPSLLDGDIVTEINGQRVRSVADLEAHTTAALGASGTAEILVGFERGLERRVTVIQAGEHRQDSGGLEAAKAWVPVAVQVLTPPIADRLKLSGRTGVRVTRVIDAGAGLQVGDVILAIDNEPVRATSPGDEEVFAAAIRRYRIGTSVPLTISRGGAESTVTVKLAASPKPPREMSRYVDSDFEFMGRDLTENDRDGQKVPVSTRGVFVESVSRGGWADLAQLNTGDVILSVDGKAVSNVAELEAAMKAIAARKPSFVILHVRRGVRTRFIELQPTWK